jgi:hypothetical protein
MLPLLAVTSSDVVMIVACTLFAVVLFAALAWYSASVTRALDEARRADRECLSGRPGRGWVLDEAQMKAQKAKCLPRCSPLPAIVDPDDVGDVPMRCGRCGGSITAGSTLWWDRELMALVHDPAACPNEAVRERGPGC